MISHAFLSAAAIVVGASTQAAVAATPADPADPSAKRHAQVSLVAEHEQLVAGSTSYLGVHFKLEPRWHTYWLGTPQASGQLELSIDLPEGFTLGPILWPAPSRHVSEGDLLDYVYENEVTLILPVRVPVGAKPGPVKITGKATYLVCSTACVFEEASLTMATAVAPADTKPANSGSASLFREARARLPLPLPSGPDAPRITRSGDAFTIEAPGASGLSFFPAADAILLSDLVTAGTSASSRLSLRVETGADASAPFRGVLEVRYPDKRPTAWFAVEPTPQHPQPKPTSPSGVH